MKKEEEKEPMFKVVEPPRSKKSKNEREQEERGKGTRLPTWKSRGAGERPIIQKTEGKDADKTYRDVSIWQATYLASTISLHAH